jgi:rare lipoprotein A
MGWRRIGVTVLLAAAMAGCATRAPSPLPGSDGPEARPPPDLMQVPDALPKLEPIRQGGPNKPYEVLGGRYEPLPARAEYSEDGLASWYGRKFHGRRTASGEVYNMYAMTAAHKTLPIPSYARVTNPANGRSIIVRVNDRGPFVRGRIIDLSYTAALQLDTLRGVVPVRVERITPEQIASGAWRGAPSAAAIAGDDGGPPEPAPALATAVPAAPPTPLTPPPGASTDATASESTRAPTAAGRGFWVQLGAYRERGGAMQLQQQASERVDGLALLLAVFSDNALHRVQAGPFATRDEAQRVAERVREQLLLTPLVVERR